MLRTMFLGSPLLATSTFICLLKVIQSIKESDVMNTKLTLSFFLKKGAKIGEYFEWRASFSFEQPAYYLVSVL
jgi:hypothetical protein